MLMLGLADHNWAMLKDVKGNPKLTFCSIITDNETDDESIGLSMVVRFINAQVKLGSLVSLAVCEDLKFYCAQNVKLVAMKETVVGLPMEGLEEHLNNNFIEPFFAEADRLLHVEDVFVVVKGNRAVEFKGISKRNFFTWQEPHLFFYFIYLCHIYSSYSLYIVLGMTPGPFGAVNAESCFELELANRPVSFSTLFSSIVVLLI